MNKTFKNIVKILINNNLTISTMESCTGGAIASAITDIEGSSSILKYSAITYSNEYKIEMGINPLTIEKCSVYSIETAQEMAYNISKYTNSDIGIGITGKLNRIDPNNERGKDNEVFISIYYNKKYYNQSIIVNKKTRKQNKNLVLLTIINRLEEILWKEELIR